MQFHGVARRGTASRDVAQRRDAARRSAALRFCTALRSVARLCTVPCSIAHRGPAVHASAVAVTHFCTAWHACAHPQPPGRGGMGGLWWGPTAAAQNKAPIERRRFHPNFFSMIAFPPPAWGEGGREGHRMRASHTCVYTAAGSEAHAYTGLVLCLHTCVPTLARTRLCGAVLCPPPPPRSYGPHVPRMAPLLLCLHFYAPPVPHIPNVPSVPMPPMYPMAPPCPSMSPRVPMSPHLHDPILCCPHVPIPPPRGTLRVGVTRGRRGEEGMRGVGTAASLPGRVHAWAHPREPPRPLPRLSPPH